MEGNTNIKTKRDWSNTKYTKLVRISGENHEFLKQLKMGRCKMAGKLDIIISQYRLKLNKEAKKQFIINQNKEYETSI